MLPCGLGLSSADGATPLLLPQTSPSAASSWKLSYLCLGSSPLSGYRKTTASLQVFLPGGQCPPGRLCPCILFIHSQALSHRAERMCSALVSPEAVAVTAVSHPAPSTQHPARRMQGGSLMSEHMDCLVSLRQEEGLHCCVSLSLHILVALIFTV